MKPQSAIRTTATPRFPRRWLLASALALALPTTAWADAVTDWNSIANGVIGGAGGPPHQFRAFAMVHLAIHDALNAIDPRYDTYSVVAPGNPNASPEAAVAAAARRVLVDTLPSAQDVVVEAAYASYLSGLSCPAAQPGCIGAGTAVGDAAAQAILDLRANDGSATPHLPYTLAPSPGVYQPTLPLPQPQPGAPYPQYGNWGNVTPFALGSARQFGPGRTEFMRLAGDSYTRDFNEVKAVGSAAVRGSAANIESEESRIARHWPLNGGANVNGFTRVIVANRVDDLWENARLFALVNVAVNDGLLVVFDAKFRYNFWRPYTAIREAANDGNPATQADAEWNSYIVTPPYPDYPCGLPSTIATSTEVLRSYFGTDEVPFDFGTPSRHYDRLSEAAAESAMARVYGGIHFRTGCLASLELGQKVGHFVYTTQLKPRH